MVITFPLNSRAKVTALKQPKELFCFARELDNSWIYDKDIVKNEKLSYYYLPDADIKIDLQQGYSNFKKIPEEENLGDFKSLLTALSQYEKFENNQTKIPVDIITFRGLMTKILTIPYNSKDNVNLNIIAYDGQLFISNDEKLELSRRLQELNSRAQLGKDKQEYISKCEYSGYKFEKMATIPKPWSQCSRSLINKRNKQIVNNYEQYISVIRTGIGKVKMALAGEIDCIWDYIPENAKDILNHYVELKTSRVIDHKNQMINFEKKLFKTWGQCFLMGIKKIVYGFRDDNFICQTVEIYETEEIPILIKNNKLSDINCMGALKWYGAVIEWLDQTIDKSDESQAWRLGYDPGSKTFSLIELSGEENSNLRNGGMLTEEFKQWRQSLKGSARNTGSQ
jgi:RAT1-interacting protein